MKTTKERQISMKIEQALDCVRNHWDATCPVGQRQAANVLAEYVAENVTMQEDIDTQLKEVIRKNPKLKNVLDDLAKYKKERA